jgi:hypothetical protein
MIAAAQGSAMILLLRTTFPWNQIRTAYHQRAYSLQRILFHHTIQNLEGAKIHDGDGIPRIRSIQRIHSGHLVGFQSFLSFLSFQSFQSFQKYPRIRIALLENGIRSCKLGLLFPTNHSSGGGHSRRPFP